MPYKNNYDKTQRTSGTFLCQKRNTANRQASVKKPALIRIRCMVPPFLSAHLRVLTPVHPEVWGQNVLVDAAVVVASFLFRLAVLLQVH